MTRPPKLKSKRRIISWPNSIIRTKQEEKPKKNSRKFLWLTGSYQTKTKKGVMMRLGNIIGKIHSKINNKTLGNKILDFMEAINGNKGPENNNITHIVIIKEISIKRRILIKRKRK